MTQTSTVCVRSTVACRIAGIDRDRFNEHVAAGRFPCAPRVRKGETRLFDATDLLLLFLFARLLEFGLNARKAGHLVGNMADLLKTPEAAAAPYLVYWQGNPGDDVRLSNRADMINDVNRTADGWSASIPAVLGFDLKSAREFVAAGLAGEITGEASQ